MVKEKKRQEMLAEQAIQKSMIKLMQDKSNRKKKRVKKSRRKQDPNQEDEEAAYMLIKQPENAKE